MIVSMWTFTAPWWLHATKDEAFSDQQGLWVCVDVHVCVLHENRQKLLVWVTVCIHSDELCCSQTETFSLCRPRHGKTSLLFKTFWFGHKPQIKEIMSTLFLTTFCHCPVFIISDSKRNRKRQLEMTPSELALTHFRYLSKLIRQWADGEGQNWDCALNGLINSHADPLAERGRAADACTEQDTGRRC